MITEIATIAIDPTTAAAFEAAVAEAAPHFRAAEGCHGFTLDRCIEEPARYFLRVEWESVDHHMVRFRASEGFQKWRTLAGPFFAAPPIVEHSARAVTGF